MDYKILRNVLRSLCDNISLENVPKCLDNILNFSDTYWHAEWCMETAKYSLSTHRYKNNLKLRQKSDQASTLVAEHFLA